MSGITPLLDTLLHQVLGPKGDISAQKQLNQPVRNVEPGEGPRALQSDSRTDSRPNSQAHAILSQGKYADTRLRGQVQQPPVQQGTPANASAQLHLTQTGRTIAEIIGQYPALAKAVVAKAPLITTTENPTSQLLGVRLQQAVQQSGLFYEHALKQWYRGQLPREQLALQPQALALPQSPTQAEAKVIAESLQTTVRQQLEMLAQPTLRWEGDLWSGLFLALTVTILQRRDESRDENNEEQRKRQNERGWKTEMVLDVQKLGPLRLAFQLKNNCLDLQFTAAETIIDQLEAHEESLRIRMQRLGLDEVQIRTTIEEVVVSKTVADSSSGLDDESSHLPASAATEASHE